MTGIVYHEAFLLHDTGDSHPEVPARLTSIVHRLRETGLWDACRIIEPELAADADICAVHSRSYLRVVKDFLEAGGGALTLDTFGCAESFKAAVLAANSGPTAADLVLNGELDNAFCLVRPPGHHARPEQPMGFCIFNNIAITARYLHNRHGIRRIAIIDWDAHHGNGTQEAFYRDGGVFFFSPHRAPFYPFTGEAGETGEGTGRGTTLNVPLPFDTPPERYLEIFDAGIERVRDFGPEFVLVSAGFDAFSDDPMAGLNLEPEHFGELTRRVVALAADCCDGRLISLLEGGYHLDGLARCAAEHVDVLTKSA